MKLIVAILAAAVLPIMVGLATTGHIAPVGSFQGVATLVIMAVALAGYRHAKKG